MSSGGGQTQSLGGIPQDFVIGIVVVVVILIVALVTLLVVVFLKLRNKLQNDIDDHSLSATEAQVLQLPSAPAVSPSGMTSRYSHPTRSPGLPVPNNDASGTDFEYVNPLVGPNPPVHFPGHGPMSPRSLGSNQNTLWEEDPHYSSPRSPIQQRGIPREDDPHYVSPRSPIQQRGIPREEDPHYVSPRAPIQQRGISREEDPHYASPHSPGNNQDSSREEDPHYVSPRAPINHQGISWAEDPHYVSPRSPNNNMESSWKEGTHYASPRSPVNLQGNSWKEDSHCVTPRSPPNPHREDNSWQEEPLYANHSSQSNEQKLETINDRRPLGPGPVQEVDYSLSNKSVNQSPYDYIGKPRPVQADSGSRGLSTRRFASPFAAPRDIKSCEETEPVYANT